MEEEGETGPHGDGQKTLGKGENRWAWGLGPSWAFLDLSFRDKLMGACLLES